MGELRPGNGEQMLRKLEWENRLLKVRGLCMLVVAAVGSLDDVNCRRAAADLIVKVVAGKVVPPRPAPCEDRVSGPNWPTSYGGDFREGQT